MSFKETYDRTKAAIGARIPMPSQERDAFTAQRDIKKATRIDDFHAPANGSAIDPADPWIGGDWGVDPPEIQALAEKAHNHTLWKTDGAVLQKLPIEPPQRHTRRPVEWPCATPTNGHPTRPIIDAPKAGQVVTLYDQDHGRIAPPRPTLDLGPRTEVRTEYVYVPVRVQPPAGTPPEQAPEQPAAARPARQLRLASTNAELFPRYRRNARSHVMAHPQAPTVFREQVPTTENKIRHTSSDPYVVHEVRTAIRSFSAEAVEAQKKGVKVFDVMTARSLYMYMLENVGNDHDAHAPPAGEVRQIVEDLSHHVYGEKLKKLGDKEKNELAKIANIIHAKFGPRYKQATHGLGKKGNRKEFLNVMVDGYSSALELSQKLQHAA